MLSQSNKHWRAQSTGRDSTAVGRGEVREKESSWHYGFSPVALGVYVQGGSLGDHSLLAFFCGNTGTGGRMLFDLKCEPQAQIVHGNWSAPSFMAFEQQERQPSSSTSDRLKLIKDSFGLSIASLADIVGVARASIYNWMDTEPRDDKVVARISDLHRAATRWREISEHHFPPGKLLKRSLGGGPSMLDRLNQVPLNDREIEEGMALLLELMNQYRSRMAEVRERTRASLPSVEEQRIALDSLTDSISSGE